MESTVTLLIPALLGVMTLRLLLKPMKWFLKAAIHAAGGFLCLWLLNTVSDFTGVFIPFNAVTVCIAGFAGIPGLAFLVMLELFS